MLDMQGESSMERALAEQCERRGYEYITYVEGWYRSEFGYRVECLVRTRPTPDFMLLP